MSSSDYTQTEPISDSYAKLGLVQNSDGSFTRKPELQIFPTTAASADPPNSAPVLTKDVPINPQNNTWARIYLPRREPSAAKLPLIVFYHGGGFVLASAATTFFQKFCTDIVLHLPAIMVSVEYRLAPEHRLPAAYDDCMEALRWFRTAAAAGGDTWLTEHADVEKCYVMGNSAGGNIAFHVGLRASSCVDELAPMKIRGLILHQPYFGGVERSPSEIRLGTNETIPLHMTDIIWDLTLPVGANRDHYYCNPMKLVSLAEVDKVISEGWKILVTGYEGDPLIDRQREVAKIFRERGASVMEDFREGGCHGIEFFDDSFIPAFCDVVKIFLSI